MKRTYPGSIYVPKNTKKLYIKFKGKRIATGLDDTFNNRRQAEAILKKMALGSIGIEESYVKSIAEAITLYKNSLIRVNENTKKGYDYALKKVFTEPYKALTKDNIESQVIAFTRSVANKTTNNTYLRAVQIFLNYCKRMNYLSEFSIRKYFYRVQKQQAKSYSEDEMNRILNVTEGTQFGLFIEFMYETGARLIDALTLEWSQINLKKQIITWKNKITKEPEARPISSRATEILISLKHQKKPFSWQYSSASRLNRHLKNVFKKANIEANGRAFQEFRITFRMKLHKSGMPETYIQWLMRHSKFEITADYYTDFRTEEIKKYLP